MPKNLLLADDSITIQKVVGITFANEDFKVTTVDNGEDAVARARELKPDIILADLVMPRKNGYEVCEAVKGDPGLRHIPVLLLGGSFEAFDEGRARQARADGHIAKPFESQALINKVKELTGGKVVAPAGAPAPAQAQAARPGPPAPAPQGARPPGPGMPPAGPPRPGAPPAAARPPGPGMPPGAAPRPPGPVPPGARPPAPGMPPPGMAPRPPGPGMPPHGMAPRPPGPGMPPGQARPGAPIPPGARPPGPGMPPPGAPRPGATMPPAGMRPPAPQGPGAPAPAARPAPPQAARPAPTAVPPRPAAPPAPAPAARKDPFGLGLGAPVAPPPPSAEEDFGDIDVEPPVAATPAPAPPADLGDIDVDVDTEPVASAPSRAPIELPEEREPVEPELAPLHAFVPPAASVGHKVEPAPAAAKDGGEALLREALSKASRDVIERVVWEVVPQLAETIIRENLDRLVKQRQG